MTSKMKTNVCTLRLLVCVLTGIIASVRACVCVCVGITQDRIDDCRGAKEMAMLADVRALVQSRADLNAQDDNGVTLVSQRDTYCIDKENQRQKL